MVAARIGGVSARTAIDTRRSTPSFCRMSESASASALSAEDAAVWHAASSVSMSAIRTSSPPFSIARRHAGGF